MGKYFKLFETDDEYVSYISGTPFLPNVSYITESHGVGYTPKSYVAPILPIGTVCYYNTSAQHLKFCNISDYDSNNGPAVGLVVVPNNCTPDGTVRIMSANGVTSAGEVTSTENHMTWGLYGTNTPLTNCDTIKTWNNKESSVSGTSSYGGIPSDRFLEGIDCYGEPSVKYSSTPYIPPILTSADTQNEFCLTPIISSSVNINALCDFDGAGNTNVIIQSGNDCVAASACSAYSVNGLENGWYLPACGELVYILPKFTVLQSILTTLGKTLITVDNKAH